MLHKMMSSNNLHMQMIPVEISEYRKTASVWRFQDIMRTISGPTSQPHPCAPIPLTDMGPCILYQLVIK